MYQPPPGRPISSPPCDYQTTAEPTRKRRWFRMPDDVRNQIRADYTAGMPYADIISKHGLASRTLRRVVADLPRRGTPRKPPKPVQRANESNIAYATRVRDWKLKNDPEFSKRWGESISAAAKTTRTRIRRESLRLAAELNATETRGVWRTVREVSEHHRRHHHIERRLIAGHTYIYLMPHDELKVAPIAPDAYPAILPPPPPKAPTLWQRAKSRIVGWFR